MKNELYYGDNLDVLRRKIKDESVDLCYIDPPFNSKRNYFQIYNNQGGEDRAQAQAFVDTWEWGDEAVEGLDWIKQVDQLNSGKLTPQTVALIKGLEQVLGQGSLLAYLIHMTLRIVEIHRVLKPTGSFYLHCDRALTKLRFFANRLTCTFYLSMKVEHLRNQTAWKLAIS
jgi:DNA modification methylase